MGEEFIIERRAGISAASFSWKFTLYIGKLLFGDQVPLVVARLANSLYDRWTANTRPEHETFTDSLDIKFNEIRCWKIVKLAKFSELSSRFILRNIRETRDPKSRNFAASEGMKLSAIDGLFRRRSSEITFALPRFFECFHRDESLKHFLPPATFPMTLGAPFVSVRLDIFTRHLSSSTEDENRETGENSFRRTIELRRDGRSPQDSIILFSFLSLSLVDR